MGTRESAAFAFDAAGTFTYTVEGCEANGRWSVLDGVLHIEFTGAKDPVNNAQLRGWTARSPVRFNGAGTLLLSGVEGDEVIRIYSRIR